MTFPTASEEISALPAASTISGATTVVICQNPDGSPGGSQATLIEVVAAGAAAQPAGTSIAGTDSILGVIGGTPKLVPVSALPSGGGGGGGGASLANDPDFGTAFSTGAWVRPAGSSLTWINQGSASFDDVEGGPLILRQPIHSGNNLSILSEPVPGGDGTMPWTRRWLTRFCSPDTQYRSGGVCIINASGQILSANWYMNGGYNFALGKLTSPTSAPSNYTTNSVWHTYPPLSWWQFAYDGVNYTLSFSTNGYVFTPVYVVAATDFIGQAVATGIFVDNQDGGAYTNSADQTIELWSEVSSNP